MSIGVAIAGGGDQSKREKDDYYPTPNEVTEALLTKWKPSVAKPIWEPACGDGAISEILVEAGYSVISEDLVYRGYGTGGKDFLKSTTPQAKCIITNPPFKLAAKFIEHAHALGVEQMALVLKATYWHAKTRYPLFKKYPPQIIMPLLWRPDFLGKGAPTMDCMWCIWDNSYQKADGTKYVPLDKET